MLKKHKFNFFKSMVSMICALAVVVPCASNLLPEVAQADSNKEIIVLAGSDFQHPSGPSAGKQVMDNIISVMQEDGITQADGFLFCGDYDYDTYGNASQVTEGVNAVKASAKKVVTNEENIVLVQGNHDTAIGTSGMSMSGDNDPKSGEYGVFAIHEDDYMQFNRDKGRIQETAQLLVDYLNLKLAESYEKPIFIVSHLPLHYTGRTTHDGDGKYAHYIFDALNDAAEKGLDIFFLYGHNHSNGWEDYLGGAAVFMTKGDEVLIPQGSQAKADCAKETLNFTILNAGYTGYYGGTSGIDSTLTMTAFKITDDEVTVIRYSQTGTHDLKSEGISSDSSIVNKKTYTSPQVVTLQNVTDTTPLNDVISIEKVGNKYARIDSTSEIFNGSRYLLVCNTSGSAFALPSIVTKTNSGGSARTGLDLENAENIGWKTIYGEYTAKEWLLISQNGGWLLSNGEKYLKLTSTDNYGITATFEDVGDVFTISGSGGSFTFASGGYVLNYNSRGLINGYNESPASFTLYALSGHLITINGGVAFVNGVKTDAAKGGQTVQISAPTKENSDFDKWVVESGSATIENATAQTTEFIMPNESVTISAIYTQHVHDFSEHFASPEFLKVGTSNVYYASCACGESSKGTADEALFGSFRITSGRNAEWIKDTQAEGLTYKTNANDTLSAMKVNGAILDSDAYTVDSDGTITLKSEYLNTLEDGTYQLRLSYALGDCSTTFIVETPVADTPTPDVPPTDSSESQPTTPSTPNSSASSVNSASENEASAASGGCASSLSTLYAGAFACGLALLFIACKRKEK